jgi:hypothetical protein
MYVRYVTGERELYDLRADPFELENLAGVPALAAVLTERDHRLRELCMPPPPGYRDRASTSVPIALLALGLLLVLEIGASRRRPVRRRVAG